jgi:uncharacterized membrane protein YphA (DoxX/SURF4 family)
MHMSNFTNKSATVARLLLGTIFFVFGLNGFLQFLPQPPMPEAAGAFIGGLASAGYFFPLLKGLEVAAGIALLSNRFVPLALTVLAPITVNILLFHVVLAPAPALPLVIIAAQLFLAWAQRDVFAALLHAKTEHSPASSPVGRPLESHA